MRNYLKLLKPAESPDHDPEVVRKFIRRLSQDGKIAAAQRVFNHTLTEITKCVPRLHPLDVLIGAIEHVKPAVEVRRKRVGGATYQVPMQVSRARQETLAIRWIITAARGRAGRPIHLRLAEEIVAAYRGARTS
jgi:small subunit ribosomal protein S7